MIDAAPGSPDAALSPDELLDRESLAALHSEKLRRQIAYVYERSPFYRDKFDAAGVKPDHIRSVADLARLPFTEKDEVRASLAAHPPLGRHLCVPLTEIIQRQASSGTTGKPSYIAYTKTDLEALCEMTARCFHAAGFRRGDLILHAFAMSRGFVGGLPMAQSLAHMGCSILPIGAESGVERLLGAIADQNPVGIVGAPSFLTYMAGEAERVTGRPAAELGVKHILVGSEPGGGLPETRARLERLWGATIREMYGLSDLGNSFYAEQLGAEGMFFRGQGLLHAELIDPDTGEVLPEEKGVSGEFAYTSLVREAMPFVRFRSRDRVEVVETAPFGRRWGARYRVMGRTDDMLIWRGLNVYPSAIQDIVHGLRPLTTGLFKILADFEGHTTNRPLKLRVESTRAEDAETARERVSSAVEGRIGVKVAVEIVPAGTFESPGSRKPVLIERVTPAS